MKKSMNLPCGAIVEIVDDIPVSICIPCPDDDDDNGPSDDAVHAELESVTGLSFDPLDPDGWSHGRQGLRIKS